MKIMWLKIWIKHTPYLYIDVGGGSTELTLFNNNKLVFKESYNIGTIRLLQNQVTDNEWDEMRNTIREDTKGLQNRGHRLWWKYQQDIFYRVREKKANHCRWIYSRIITAN